MNPHSFFYFCFFLAHTQTFPFHGNFSEQGNVLITICTVSMWMIGMFRTGRSMGFSGQRWKKSNVALPPPQTLLGELMRTRTTSNATWIIFCYYYFYLWNNLCPLPGYRVYYVPLTLKTPSTDSNSNHTLDAWKVNHPYFIV